ncbi:MAG: response regulator transcription factor [Ktedonobacterales bacterium]
MSRTRRQSARGRVQLPHIGTPDHTYAAPSTRVGHTRLPLRLTLENAGHAEPRTNGSSALALLEQPLTLPARVAVAARRRILIVEDDPRVAQVIRESLALEGEADWSVEVAAEGARALALAYAAPPDLVLLDVRLPDLDGAEVYRRLRAEAKTSGARILFLTAGASFDLYQRGIEDGVLLRKPFDLETLVSLVRALVED